MGVRSCKPPGNRVKATGSPPVVQTRCKRQPKNFSLLGRAVAAVGPPPHRAAAPRPHPLADRDRHAVDDEVADGRLPVGEQRAEHVEQQGQPVGQGMDAPREARGRERAGEVARGAQHGERARVVVPEERRGHDRHRQHLRVAHPGQAVARVPQGAHRLVRPESGGCHDHRRGHGDGPGRAGVVPVHARRDGQQDQPDLHPYRPARRRARAEGDRPLRHQRLFHEGRGHRG